MVLTTIPAIFKNVYHERVGIAGLNYISLGIGEYAHTDNFPLGIWLKCAPAGLVIATQVNGRALDRVYKHLKARNGGIGQPEFRLSTSLGGPSGGTFGLHHRQSPCSLVRSWYPRACLWLDGGRTRTG